MSLSFSIFDNEPCCNSCAEHAAAERVESETLGNLRFGDNEIAEYGAYVGPYVERPLLIVDDVTPPVYDVPIPIGPNQTVTYHAPAPQDPVYQTIFDSYQNLPGAAITHSPQSPPFNPGVSIPAAPAVPAVPVFPAVPSGGGKQTPLPADDKAAGVKQVLGFEIDNTTILIGGAVAVVALVLLVKD